MPYIEKENEQQLKNFKYKGTCASITYKYLWSPFAEFLLKFVPQTIAPNAITLFAFAIIVISHAIFMFYGDSSFQKAPEPWKYALFGISLFLYQHLDNLDGKQARKTKNSSPVGMLFDHGCDAISTTLVGIQFVKLIQCQDVEMTFYFLVIILFIPNFLIIWTQYATGAFHFDEINPVDQGLPCYQLMGIAGYFIDFSFWKNHHWISSYNNEFLITFVVIVIVLTTKMTKNIFKDTNREKKDLISTLILPAILIILLGLIWIGGLRTQIYKQHFYLFFYGLSFFWTRNEIYMQICSVANQKFNPLNLGTISYVIGIILAVIVPGLQSYLGTYLLILLIIQLILLLQLATSFLLQASSILGIKLFSINKIEQKTN